MACVAHRRNIRVGQPLKHYPMRSLSLLLAASLLLVGCGQTEVAPPAPLRALLVLGGCCHDYATQKDILKAGIEQRANVIVDIVYSADKTTAPALPIFGNPNYADGYDVVIHDECAADVSDHEIIAGVLAPHRAGVPGVNLHCAMHSYRGGNFRQPVEPGSEWAHWYDYIGLQSTGHGPQLPLEITITDDQHAITGGLSGWTTGREELYNQVGELRPTAHVLARGKQVVNGRETESPVAWTNDYQGTRVFSTTIGHNNETVSSSVYLDLVARGVLWACGKLDANGQPQAGYGAPTPAPATAAN